MLEPGLAAFRRGGYADALAAWEKPGLTLQGDERALCLALMRLASALSEEQGGRRENAEPLYRAAVSALEPLPPGILGLDLDRLRRELPGEVSAALAAPPELAPAREKGRWVVGRFVVLVLFVATALAIVRWTPVSQYFTEQTLSTTLSNLRQIWWAPLAFVGLYVVLCPLGIPVSPLILAGGIVFGTGWGTLYNFVGNFLGAATTFFVGRHMGRDFVVHMFGERLRGAEKLLARHGFWTLLRVRFIPIPFPVVNYGAALAGIRAPIFLWSSALGLAPAIFLYTWFASALVAAAGPRRGTVLAQLALALGAILVLTFLPTAVRRLRRRRRYRRLREQRRRRSRAPRL